MNKNKGMELFYPDVASAIAELTSEELNAVVYDAPVFRYYLSKKIGTRLRLVGPIFGKQSYGIGLQQDSPLRVLVNRALLALNERGFMNELQKKWFGGRGEL